MRACAIAYAETIWREDRHMHSVRSIDRAMREERAARTQRTVGAGPGRRFCQRHNIRFAIKDGGCHLLPAPATLQGPLTAFRRDRHTQTKSREAENRLANEWRICEKHGGDSPNVQGG